MVQTNNNTTYYINPSYLSFVEDSGYGANLIQVSASSSCYIRAFIPGVIGYDADGNYRRWKITAYNNKFPNNEKYYIYARLERSGVSALVIYSVSGYLEQGNTDGGAYYYIKIGEVSGTDGYTIREIRYDTGRLESDQVKNEGPEVNEMWELDKYSTPWLIKAKQWLAGFTVKGFISLIGGFIFKKGEDEKIVTDIKRSMDSDEDVPVGDDNLPTSQYMADYVEEEIEKLDERFLLKIRDDETPYNLGIGRNLKVGGTASIGGDVSVGGEVVSKHFAKDTRNAGYAIHTNDEGEYEAEADNIVARILAKTYDLLVQNHATFVGDLTSEEFISGFLSGKGWAIRTKEFLNAAGVTEKKSVAEFDDLIVRGSMRVYEFIVSQLLGENDNRIFTGMMEVDHYDASEGKIYLRTDGGRLYNPFRVDDVIIVQQYSGNPSEENGYYVTKQYEFIVTEAGVGEAGEDRLDWVRFRNFTTSMEGGDESLIVERDTLVRLDNLSDANRKGIVQIMAVGEDTPYMDFIYAAKTDPDNSLKGRLGNLGGIYNPLFGWLKEFGAYLTNLYAVGEFVIAHTGENVSDSIEIAKGQFRTNFRQTTFDMSEENNFFTNASLTNNCEYWTLGADTTEYFIVDDLPQFFNFDLYTTEDTYAGIAEWKGRDMLRLSSSTARQANSLIKKAGTHKVYTNTIENEDGTYTDVYEDVPDTLYLSVRFYVASSGKVDFGFVNASGAFINNSFRYSEDLTSREDGYEVKLSGTWDGNGDFCIASTGDVYVDLLSLTDRPLDNFKITTETKIEQDARRIALLGKKVNGVEGSVTNLGVELNAAEEQIRLYANKVGELESSVSALDVTVKGISTTVASVQGTANDAKSLANAAQSAADSAAAKATANATAISQQASSISLLAGAFTLQNGNYVLTSAAGAVITNEVASLYATKTTVNSLGDRVTSAEASIKVNADNITSKVSKNGVISSINQSSESVTINASKINLNGAITANKTFKIDTSGYMTCTGGTIASFTISGGILKNDNGDADILIRNTTTSPTKMAGIGLNVVPDTAGYDAMGVFINNNPQGASNYGVIVSAKNGIENTAIWMQAGCIKGFAVKVGEYSNSKQIAHGDNIVIQQGYNIYLPTMTSADTGHIVTVISNYTSAAMVHVAENSNNYIINGSSKIVAFQIGALSTATFVYIHSSSHDLSGTKRIGAWVKI